MRFVNNIKGYFDSILALSLLVCQHLKALSDNLKTVCVAMRQIKNVVNLFDNHSYNMLEYNALRDTVKLDNAR